jgi:hypothetical protein
LNVKYAQAVRLVESIVEAFTSRVEAIGVAKLVAICQVDILELRYHESWDADEYAVLLEFARINFHVVHASG